MKGKKQKYGILCLGILMMGGIGVAAFYNFSHKNTDEIKIGEIDEIEKDKTGRRKIMCENDKLILTQYLKNLLDIDLEDYAEAAEGEVIIKEDDENSSMIKVKIFKEYEETVLEILEDTFSGENNKMEPYDDGVPPFCQNTLIEEVETKDWKYTFDRMKTGKYAMTKLIYIFVTYDDDRLYLYFWE